MIMTSTKPFSKKCYFCLERIDAEFYHFIDQGKDLETPPLAYLLGGKIGWIRDIKKN